MDQVKEQQVVTKLEQMPNNKHIPLTGLFKLYSGKYLVCFCMSNKQQTSNRGLCHDDLM